MTQVLHHRQRELRGTMALAAVAVLIGAAFGLSTLITPLYLLYQQALGFSQITLTLIYAAYVIGNVTALLFFGHASDQLGRRMVALGAILILIVADLVFLFSAGIASLYIGRILSGLGIGITSGTGNAWLAELAGKSATSRAATVSTSVNFLGLGLTPLLSGVLAQYAPWPLKLPFALYLALLCGVALLIWFVPETVRHPIRGAMRGAARGGVQLSPNVSVPRAIRTQFVAPAITGFGLMALVGFYAALMPVILAHDLHIHNHAAAGALFFELAAVVALVIVATQRLASRMSMLASLAIMIPAAASVPLAQVSGSLPAMVAATAIVGVSAGLGYRASLQMVNQIAPAGERAALISSYFLCCFAGNSLPVIGVGILASVAGAVRADIAFAAAIGVFAIVALIFGRRLDPAPY